VLENNFNSNLDETELRKKITDETSLLEQIKSLKQRILESQRQKEKIETEINTLNNTHIKKYTKVNSVEEIISLKNAKTDIILENQKKRDEIQIILQQIEKYKEYEKTLESWQNIYKKKTYLEAQEIEERKRHAAACLLRDKILEAESIAIQNMIDNINTHVQLYLEYFFPDNPINVRINAFKETKKEESKPSINLEIDYKGIEHDLTMLSGGELSRIILAFTLALAEIHNCPLIMLDECTSSLDQDLTSSVISGLKENFGEKLVILIAHQVVQGVFDKTIKLS
jgi:DNA repair exonuclease SbcCD ATPase subunit